jgi:hypothetical protein
MVANHRNAPAAAANAGAAGGAGAGAGAYGNGNNGKTPGDPVNRGPDEGPVAYGKRAQRVVAARKARIEKNKNAMAAAAKAAAPTVAYTGDVAPPSGIYNHIASLPIEVRSRVVPGYLGKGEVTAQELEMRGISWGGGSRKSKKSLKRENRKVGGSYNNGKDIDADVDKLAGEGIVAYSIRKPKVIAARTARIEGQKTRNARLARDTAAHRTAVEMAESRALGFGAGPRGFATKNIYDVLSEMELPARRSQITSLLSSGQITKEELEKRHIAYGGSRKTRRVVKRKQSKSRKNKK